tara:strand:+ start:2180 stop:2605 length:426 start_codon:yes stop_codon:yes gene_type:complete
LNKRNKENKSDQKNWEEFINNPTNIFDKDNIDSKKRDSFKKFKFDFHGFSIDKANLKIEELILKCLKQGIREILIITGKGIHSKNEENVYVSKDFSKLQSTIPNFIKNNSSINSNISSINVAPEELGGNGALVIKLKKIKE